MKEKTVGLRDSVEVHYTPERWGILKKLRQEAQRIGSAVGPGWAVHGSVARGDVKTTSDIDLISVTEIQSYLVEIRLESAGIGYMEREVVMATPNSTPKCHFHVDDKVTVTFPLANFRMQEESFYRFGGMLPAQGIEDAGRVRGVNKKLLLIEPTASGHREHSIAGCEAEAARLLEIGVNVVNERVRVLRRRDKIGRTGVYLRETVVDGASCEETLKRLADRDPVVRRAVGGR